MTTPNADTTAGAKSIPATDPNKARRSTKKSTWWKRGPNLVQHTPTGTFYARVKLHGKLFRASLGTDVFTTARLRLPDKLKELQTPEAEVGTFAEGRLKYEAETSRGSYTNKRAELVELSPLSQAYRLRCLELLRRSLVEVMFHSADGVVSRTWKDLPEPKREEGLAKLDATKASELTKEHYELWQSHFAGQYSPTVFNNTVNTARRVFEFARLPHDANPFYKVGRRKIHGKELNLPTDEQFDRILKVIETSGAAQARDCADLVRFLAYTGCRIAEAKKATWADVNWQLGFLRIHSVKVRAARGNDITRELPLIPALKQLLERMHQERNPQPADRICVLGECQNSLTRACRLVGCKRLVHHDLRHYFTSQCVKAKVDVVTLANWLGHKDNGKLLLKVYAHLDKEHAQKEAAKVTFGAAPTPANVLPLSAAAAANGNA